LARLARDIGGDHLVHGSAYVSLALVEAGAVASSVLQEKVDVRGRISHRRLAGGNLQRFGERQVSLVVHMTSQARLQIRQGRDAGGGDGLDQVSRGRRRGGRVDGQQC